MHTAAQLRTFTTASLMGGGWYLDCPLTFIHLDEIEFQKSFDGLGIERIGSEHHGEH